jgi:hypothetical protein
MTASFRDQIVERLRLHLGEADLPPDRIETFASEVVFIFERMLDSRAFDAAAREILQRYAEEWSEQASNRLLESPTDGATDLVHEMIDRQGRTRAVRALRRALTGILEGIERPPDDLGIIEDDEI